VERCSLRTVFFQHPTAMVLLVPGPAETRGRRVLHPSCIVGSTYARNVGTVAASIASHGGVVSPSSLVRVRPLRPANGMQEILHPVHIEHRHADRGLDILRQPVK